MTNKRQFERRHLVYYLKVSDADTKNVLGYLVDITVGGMRLLSEEAIPLDRAYSIVLEVPCPDGTSRPIELKAQSLWSRPDVNPDFLDTGFCFIDPPEEAAEEILRLVDDLALADDGAKKGSA